MQRIIYRAECFDLNVVVEVIMNTCIAHSSSVKEYIIIEELKNCPDLAEFIRAKKRDNNFKLSADLVFQLFSFKHDKYLSLAEMVLLYSLYSNTIIKEKVIKENEGKKEFTNYIIEVLRLKKFLELPISQYFTYAYYFNDTLGKRAAIINLFGDLSRLFVRRKLIPSEEIMAIRLFVNETIDMLQLTNESDEISESSFPINKFTRSELSLVCFVALLSVISSVSAFNHESEYILGIFFNKNGISNDIIDAESTAASKLLGLPLIKFDIH